MNSKKISPKEYFDTLKNKKNKITDGDLVKACDNAISLANKYLATGQEGAIEKLAFLVETIEKEREIVKMGIDTFVYRQDIEYFIDKVADDVVKIIDIKNFDREIPDELVEVIQNTKDKFDEFFIVFTDYTGEKEREVKKERIEKDPILFGAFLNEETKVVADRFYFLGDWVDEYCDLTLDKMICSMKEKEGVNIERKISTPSDLKALKEQFNSLEKKKHDIYIIKENNKKPSFIKKVRTYFKGKK